MNEAQAIDFVQTRFTSLIEQGLTEHEAFDKIARTYTPVQPWKKDWTALIKHNWLVYYLSLTEGPPVEVQFKMLLCKALGKPYTHDLTLDSLSQDVLTLRSTMQLIVRGRCGVCKRMNTPGCATISDGEGGEGCGEGKLCYHDSVDAEQAAIFALETIGVK